MSFPLLERKYRMNIIVTNNDGEDCAFLNATVKEFTIKFKQGGRSYTATLETDNISKIVLDREEDAE